MIYLLFSLLKMQVQAKEILTQSWNFKWKLQKKHFQAKVLGGKIDHL